MELQEYAKPISITNKSDIGILLIHGFTGSNASMFYLAEKYTDEGYNVESPILKGHGTQWKDLDNVKYQDWIEDVILAYNNLKEKSKYIFPIGLSMGGSLALYLAQRDLNLAGVIVINNTIFINSNSLKFVPIGRFFIKSVKGIGNDLKDKTQNEMPYNKISTNAIHEFYKFINLVKSRLDMVSQPALIFKSVEDHVVKFESASYTYDNISSTDKEIIWLKNSYHVATLDFDKDIIFSKSVEFINRILKLKEKKSDS